MAVKFKVNVDKIDIRKLKSVSKKLKDMKNIGVKVGFFDGKEHKDSGLTIADVAAVNEYGSDDGKIPSRPFMRQTIRKHNEYKDLLAKETGAVMDGRRSPKQFQFRVGEQVRADVVEEIGSKDFVPNSPVTVAEKGSSTPLIDTGTMRGDVDWREG